MTTTHRRTCHLCEANCGLLLEVEAGVVRSVRGNPAHVLSRGHLCPKAAAIGDLQADPDRLRRPLRRDGEGWTEIEWDVALAEIEARLTALGGAQAAIYVGNPTAHNYAIGTQLRDLRRALGVRALYSASTLDQMPHQVVQMWMYGHNALFPVPDVDRAHTVVIVGGNPLASNGSLWTVPDVRRRLRAVQERGGAVIVVDPRRTETAKIADAHHFIRPGTDPAFFLGLLVALDQAGAVAPGRLAAMLDDGWDAAWAQVRRFDLAALADHCGVPEAALRGIAAALAGPEPALVYGRVGVSTQEWGTLNAYLLQLINIATGNLDRVGGVMFTNPAVDLVTLLGRGSHGRFHSRVGGHPEALSELPAATLAAEILEPGEGRVEILVTVAGNPVLSAPGGRRLDEALARLALMISVDLYVTETSRHAHYILPPCGPLERDHYPMILAPLAIRDFACYSPPILERSPGALDDWEILAALAERASNARGTPKPAGVDPRVALDMALRASGRGLTLAEVEAAPDGVDLGPLAPRLPDRLQTADKKIHAAPPACLAELGRFAAELERRREPDPPGTLRLIGRRHLRSNNSWLHNSERLVKGPQRCTLLIHPEDAAAAGIADGDLVEVRSSVGAVELPAEVSDDIMPGTVSIPHGWGHDRPGVRLTVAGRHAGVSINDLTDPARLDPVSGNAAFSATPVSVSRRAP
ncbi:MAG: molybdopterin dinucleotide binding domain-containing protein [Nannocystaceae bacterium]